MKNKPIIFVDSDGVCADFESFYHEAFEHRHDSVTDEQMWKNINAHGKFFSSLPMFEGTKEFIEKWRKTHEVVILTACPKSNYQTAAVQKRDWFKQYIADDIMVLPMLGGKNKVLFMQKKGDVLIDDYEKNITPWIDAGGLGIVHKDWKTTDETLTRMLDL